jgi:hypothetical protein
MSSTELGPTGRRRVGLSTTLSLVVMVFAGVGSVSFSSRAQTQPETARESRTLASPTVEVALLVAAFGAYGWAANKLYDLGKEVGRARANRCGGRLGPIQLGHRPERLLD